MGETSDARYRAGNGEPLLLLHGFTGTWRLWHPVLAELVARFDVLAPTLPGHYGGPPAHLENPFSLGDLADWVEDELDAHGMPTAHIVGNSMGGALALELAKRGRARSVLAISPGFSWLPGNPEGPRIAKHFRKQHASTHKNEPRLDRVMRWSLIRHHALGAAMYHGERMSPHDAVAMARASLGCTVTDQVLAAIESGSSALECLDEVAVPTLIAWPEHDRTTPPGAAQCPLRKRDPRRHVPCSACSRAHPHVRRSTANFGHDRRLDRRHHGTAATSGGPPGHCVVVHPPHPVAVASSSAARLGGSRFVRGAVRYLDDETPHDCLHVAFVRSPHAHAALLGVDSTAVERLPGIRAVLDGATARGLIGELMCLAHPMFTGLDAPIPLPCIAIERVRFAGEPVALVVAETEQQARRAASLVQLSYEPLAPLIDLDDALAPGAATLYPPLTSNVLMAGVIADGDVDAAMACAERTIEGRVELGRGNAVPLEPRGCIAVWDTEENRLLVRASVQQPHMLRADLARLLALPESDIRVVAPALGGAFGFKFIGSPEEPLTCLMARRLGQPVRWVETRAEALLTGAREYRASYRVGYDGAGRVTALSVDLDANVGALSATPGLLMPSVAAATFPGGYDLADFAVRWRTVVSNKGPWNGARGFGKEATALVLESALDDVARDLGIDPVDVRRVNLLRSEQMPHRTASMTIDSGDYHAAVDLALSLAEYDEARARQRDQDPASPVRLGIGVAFELTPEGMDFAGSPARGSETSTVRLDTTGYVTVLCGATSPGTGSETAIAQLVAERIGVPATTSGWSRATPTGHRTAVGASPAGRCWWAARRRGWPPTRFATRYLGLPPRCSAQPCRTSRPATARTT